MKIIVIDDDKLVALSLQTILESDGNIEILGIGHSGKDAIELYKSHKPDVLLMDIRMNEMTGLEAGEIILKEFPDAKILFLTTFSDDEYIVKALNIGAKGYILKQDFEGIASALTSVYNGQSVFGSEIVEKIPTMLEKQTTFDSTQYDLTEKEIAIIQLVSQGLSNKEISEDLYLSEGTVRNYISTILEKLSLRDRTQLAIFYYQKMQSC